MGAIIVCGFLKGVVILWTLWYQHDETLVTLGDAVVLASWLDKPDAATKGDYLMSKAYTRLDFLKWRTHYPNFPHPVARIRPGVRRWGAAVNVKRWLFAMIFYSIALGSASFFLALAIPPPANFVNQLRFAFRQDSFGAVSPGAMVETKLPVAGATGLMTAVLVVNSPQLVLSLS